MLKQANILPCTAEKGQDVRRPYHINVLNPPCLLKRVYQHLSVDAFLSDNLIYYAVHVVSHRLLFPMSSRLWRLISAQWAED